MVVGKNAEHYKVDIGAAQQALLGVLSFEGASKRNKRDIKVKKKKRGIAAIGAKKKRKKKKVLTASINVISSILFSLSLLPNFFQDRSIGVLQSFPR